MDTINVVNLGSITANTVLPKDIKGRYYIYYKGDGDLYFYSSYDDVELNLFRLHLIADGTLDIELTKVDNGTLDITLQFLDNGNLDISFIKTNLGILDISIDKVNLGKLNIILTKNGIDVPTGSMYINVSKYLNNPIPYGNINIHVDKYITQS